MKALQKKSLKIASAVIVAGVFILMWQCANPVDEPPLKWRSRIELPITNDTFYLAQKIPEMFTGINDTIVQYWNPGPFSGTDSSLYPQGKLPDDATVPPRINSRYISTATARGWEADHVYKWTKTGWEDLGMILDMLAGGYDSANGGIYYSDTNPNLRLLDTIPGDTCVLSVPQNDSIVYEVTEDSMESKTFHPRLGSITFRNVPIKTDTISTGSTGVFNIPGTPLLIAKIHEVVFDTNSPPLSVTIRNLSTTETMSNLVVTIYWTSPVSVNFGTIGPGGSATGSFSVVNTSASPRSGWFFNDSTIWVGAGGNTTGPVSMAVDFNFNGCIAEHAHVSNYYVWFQKTFINNYELTDTLDVNYIDILDGFFKYDITNYTDMPLTLFITQQHLWRSSYCYGPANPPYGLLIERVADLATANPDSTNHMGRVGFDTVQPHSSSTLKTNFNLSECRLFPIWIDSSLINPFSTYQQSVTPVQYNVTPRVLVSDPEIIIAMSSTDSLLFVISAPQFKFREMLATVMKEYRREGDTAKVGVNYPFNSSTIDSLRGHFILNKVIGDIFLTPKLPDSNFSQPHRAYIDALGIGYTLYSPLDPLARCQTDTIFTNVWNNKHFRQQSRIDSLLNRWPDSLYVLVRVNVPVGTRVRAVNDLSFGDPDYGLYMGRMNIKAITTMRTNLVLDWRVVGTANLDLGVDTGWTVPGALDYFNRMSNTSASFNMNILNNTNVYMRLYALAAPSPRIHDLKVMRTDSVWLMIRDTARSHQAGYVSFLGPQGVGIPARGTRAREKFTLSQWQINRILSADTVAWRWEAQFLTMNSDALHDTDFVYIQSWVHLEGINNMDSLLVWPDSSGR